MLTKDEVKHIAMLARIGINDAEVDAYQKDLSAVLDFFRELQALETGTVDSIGHITGRVCVAREDRADDFGRLGKEDIMKNVPDSKGGFVKVKSVF